MGAPLAAQQTANEIWPEVDAYAGLDSTIRVYVMAARAKSREAENNVWEYGPNLDIFLKSIRGRLVTSPDQARKKYLMLRFGYRILTFPDHIDERRGIIELHARYYLPGSVLVVNRNRIDLRGRETFSWRYRPRISLEREFAAGGVRFTPYTRAEAYYDCTAAKWTRFAYIAGVVFPLGSRFEVEPSYERQINKTGEPNYTNGYGLTWSIYF